MNAARRAGEIGQQYGRRLQRTRLQDPGGQLGVKWVLFLEGRSPLLTSQVFPNNVCPIIHCSIERQASAEYVRLWLHRRGFIRADAALSRLTFQTAPLVGCGRDDSDTGSITAPTGITHLFRRADREARACTLARDKQVCSHLQGGNHGYQSSFRQPVLEAIQ